MSEETKQAAQATAEEAAAQPAAGETAAGQTAQPEAPAAGGAGAEASPEKADSGEKPADDEKTGEKEKKESRDWFNKKAHELEALRAKLDTAEKKAVETKDQLLRTAAEYDNYRKRSAREADQKFNDGVSYAVTQIIPILDTLEMAAKAPCEDEAFKKGVLMTLDKAAKALDTLQIAEIEADGKPFDPNTMNAVSQLPAPEGTESGTVLTVYQKGYRIGEKIIRHATVVVAE